MSFYEKHIFFCVNQKDNGKKCCAEGDAEAMLQHTRERCKQDGLMANNHVRVSKSGCLGRCGKGPCVVIYPEGRWYTYNSQADIDRIIDEELTDDEIVTDLLIEDTP